MNFDSNHITFDPTKKLYTLSPTLSIHQRSAFVKNKLNPSLNVIKHVKEESGCNKSLCS
jgi:hypothetical protein